MSRSHTKFLYTEQVIRLVLMVPGLLEITKAKQSDYLTRIMAFHQNLIMAESFMGFYCTHSTPCPDQTLAVYHFQALLSVTLFLDY